MRGSWSRTPPRSWMARHPVWNRAAIVGGPCLALFALVVVGLGCTVGWGGTGHVLAFLGIMAAYGLACLAGGLAPIVLVGFLLWWVITASLRTGRAQARREAAPPPPPAAPSP